MQHLECHAILVVELSRNFLKQTHLGFYETPVLWLSSCRSQKNMYYTVDILYTRIRKLLYVQLALPYNYYEKCGQAVAYISLKSVVF